ncbi:MULTISPECIES: serine protease [unclassified Pseudomonas]|uniref:trypsin-like serine peptidase n=1 Tax=unclassified Pseudomonas TaxID=196821 RepID=UPI0011A3BE72|nr:MULTISPECIES: serine protease [unclassified Pseudomonas]TWC14879.1 trypsin-like peptidase [Pseudomonas sp. SJZ075]TWC31203.1 trypsin-like peptidase [Pseudomonas sp. SJZ078]TWC52173.1 trypsin-like peptidase [Pseudomonas sp. SJZ124]TWC87103.1 trypsin-like peptidase [Pseudomonas sp. SJZ101]
MKTLFFLLVGALYSLAPNAIAHPLDYGENMQNFTASKVLENADGSYNHWRGIGRLYIKGSCTATLLDTREPSLTGPTPAYVLTSGHCIETGNGNIVTDKPVSGIMQFDYFADTPQFKTYSLKKVAWRSMQGVDLAIVELDTSLQELINEGIQPLELAQQKPAYDTDVLIVSAPLGFENATLRMAACTLQPAQEIIEGPWVWRNNLMTRCQDIAGGSSGGPILDRHSNEIIGVVGTGNLAAGLTPCDEDAPCTRIGDSYKAIAENIYGNPTVLLNGCFIQGHLASDASSSCSLYPAFTVSADSNAPARYRKLKKRDDGTLHTPTWDYRFSISTAFYRYKTVRTAKDCESGHHYSDAISANDSFINSEIGSQPGFYFLCILGVDSAAQGAEFGLIRNSLSLPVELLDDLPTAQPDLSITTGVIVELARTEKHQSYAAKFGPVETTDCSKDAGYATHTYLELRFDDTKLPVKLCTIAYDKSGQASEPRIDILKPTTGSRDADPATP